MGEKADRANVMSEVPRPFRCARVEQLQFYYSLQVLTTQASYLLTRATIRTGLEPRLSSIARLRPEPSPSLLAFA